MLCYLNNKQGDICTNRCEEWADCQHKKLASYRRLPFLVKTLDRFVSVITPEIRDGIPVMRYKQYAISPQAFENGFSDEVAPAFVKVDGVHIQKQSFYTNLPRRGTNDAEITSSNSDDMCLS